MAAVQYNTLIVLRVNYQTAKCANLILTVTIDLISQCTSLTYFTFHTM